VTDAAAVLATKAPLRADCQAGQGQRTSCEAWEWWRPYTAQLQATGGISPLTFSLVGGALPSGPALDLATGRIAGTSTVAGIFDFLVQVISSGGSSDQKDLKISVK
jgi:hypothetical protein